MGKGRKNGGARFTLVTPDPARSSDFTERRLSPRGGKGHALGLSWHLSQTLRLSPRLLVTCFCLSVFQEAL